MATDQPKRARFRLGRLLAWLFIALLVLPLVLLAWITTTESGLRQAVQLAQAVVGEQLQIEHLDGRLIGPLHMEGFRFRHANGEISLGALDLEWQPRKLFFNHVYIDSLRLADLQVINTASPAEPEPETEPLDFKLDVQLPGDVTIEQASLHNFEYQDAAQQFQLDSLILSARTEDSQLFIDALQAQAGASGAGAEGRLALTPRHDTDLSLDWQIDLPDMQELTSHGRLSIEGQPDQYRFSGSIAVDSTQIPAGEWTLAGSGDVDGLDLAVLRGQTLGGIIRARGQLRWQPQLQWDMTVDVQKVDPGQQWTEWPGQLSVQLTSAGSYSDGDADLSAQISDLSGRLREYSVEVDADLAYREEELNLLLNWTLNADTEGGLASTGRLTVEGMPRDYRFDAETALASPQIPAGEWRLSGTGTDRQLTLRTLQGEVLDGSINGRGEIAWQPRLSWNLDLTSRALNPAQHWPEWPGQLSGDLTTTGKIIDGIPEFSAQLTTLDGQLRDYPVTGQFQMALQDGTLDIEELDLQSGNNRLTASGTLGEQIALDWKLDANDLAAVLPDWDGAIDLEGQLSGSREEPGVEASIAADGISGPQLEIQSVRGTLKLQQSETAPQSIDLQASGMVFQERRFERSALEVSGTLLQHRLSLSSETGDELSIQLVAQGGWQEDRWQGTLNTARWDLPVTGAWALDRAVPVTLGSTSVQIAHGCWQQDAARLCLDVDGNPSAEWGADLQLQRLPMAFFEPLIEQPLRWDSSTVSASLQARGDAAQIRSARLNTDITSGTLRLERPGASIEQPVAGLELDAVLDAEGVNASAHLRFTDDNYLDASLQLPDFSLQRDDWQQQALALALEGQLQDPTLLEILLQEVGTATGQIAIDVRGQGTLGNPRLTGSIALQQAALGINQLGIRLEQLQLVINSDDGDLRVEGSARSGKGRMTLDGRVGFADLATWKADLQLQGEDFEVVHLPEAVVAVSPDLQVDIEPTEIHLNGVLHVPRARLKPRDLPDAVKASKDVVVVEPEQSQQTPVEAWKVYSEVQVSLGDDIRVDGFGVKGRLSGKLDLRDRPPEVTTARGKIAINKGSYTLYGRELDIVKGQLLFSGGPVDNPGLDFDAERVVGDVHAGVRVRGTLKEPELSLYSDPALSDADILSYITLGRPAAQAGEGGGNASAALAMATGNLLAEDIGESLGLEEFQVSSGGELEQASLVMGRYLSPQLYVRYSAGLYDAASQFEAIYELGKNWFIETHTGSEQSGADIIYSFER
ncbi:MAG: translocation/assembly module TamB domain-containing protein [Thiogranum sp.]|nr:translocation/assembly module TamB domain-containing protein [Thiogranum sp.]